MDYKLAYRKERIKRLSAERQLKELKEKYQSITNDVIDILYRNFVTETNKKGE